MGSKGSKQSTSSNAPPSYIANAIKGVLNQANQVNALPLTQYTGAQLAGFSPLQQQGFDTIGGAGNSWQTYFNNANDLVSQGTQDTWSQVPEFNSENLAKYQNPYLDSVLNNTINKMRSSDNQAQQDLTGDAIMAGAWGGSSASDAKMNLARQQGESRNSTIADVMNTGYNTAVTNFQGDRNAQLSALQNTANTKLQGASQLTGMGNSNLDNILNYVNGLSTAGGTQQAQEQKGLDIAKGMFDEQQAYPYQQTQYLANLISAMSGGAGGTSTSTTPGQNNTMSTIGGLASIAAAIPWSDERLKENIKKVGKLDNGLSVYKYNMKGENKTQIGVMAQDVEKKNPDAVMDIGGLKAVNYDMATRKEKQNGGGINAYASGGKINPADFTFQPASLNAPAAPEVQQDSSEQDALGMMASLAGLGSSISNYSPSNGVDAIKSVSDSTGLNKYLPASQQSATNDLYGTLSSLQNSSIQKPFSLSSIKSRIGWADGGEVAALTAPIMQEDTSYVPITEGIKAYSFNPQAIAARGIAVQTPLDTQKASIVEPVAAKTQSSGRYYVSSDGRVVDVSDQSQFSIFKNNMMNELSGSKKRGMIGLTGDALYKALGMKPLAYADGGMIDGRMGYAMGGTTDDDILNSLLQDGSIIPGITPPEGNPGIQSATLSAPDVPKVGSSSEPMDMKIISDLVRKSGGMSDINDLVSVNDSTGSTPMSGQQNPTLVADASEKPPVYDNRLDEMLDTPWRAALLNAGATMLSTNDIGKGIAAGVTGYTSVKKSKADAKKAASDLAAKAEQQKFENDIAKERLDIMRTGVQNRGSGAGRAPIDVSASDMDSIEDAALRMIPGATQIDDKGKKSASEEVLNLIGDKRLAARDVASQVYQQTRNADKAAAAYLQAIGIDPASQEFAPATEASGNWNPFKTNVEAQDAGFKPSAKKALADAKEALKNGAPRDKVIQRLKDNGISTEGL